MPLSPLGLEIGSWADCLAAVAAVCSAALSIRALTIAKDANRTAEKARAESRQTAIETLTMERDRERRAVAGTLQAWWGAVEVETGRSEWGVLVSNEGQLATVFHDVRIRCRGNKYGDRIRLTIVPPGRYFVATGTVERPWQLPRNAHEWEHYTFITKSEKHHVEEISYTDLIGTRWHWTPQAGLSEGVPEREPVGAR